MSRKTLNPDSSDPHDSAKALLALTSVEIITDAVIAYQQVKRACTEIKARVCAVLEKALEFEPGALDKDFIEGPHEWQLPELHFQVRAIGTITAEGRRDNHKPTDKETEKIKAIPGIISAGYAPIYMGRDLYLVEFHPATLPPVQNNNL